MFKEKALNVYGKFGPVIGLLVLIVVVAFLSPIFLTPSNLTNLLRQVSVNALIAFGMTFVILLGAIDLSVGSVLAFSSAIMASLVVNETNYFIALVAAVLVGAALGMMNGFVITFGKVAPFIVTLATMTVFRGATFIFTDGVPISGISRNNNIFQFIGRESVLGIPFPVILMLVVFCLLFILLHKTPFGRKVYAVGGNEKAANIVGVKISKIKILVFTMSGALAALAGVIITSRLGSAQPNAGLSYELDAIAAVVLGGTSLSGGKGRMFGTFIGILIIGVLNNGLNILGVSSFYQEVAKGAVILVAVLLDRKSD